MNSKEVNENELLVSLQTSEVNKLVIFNLDTGEEKVVIEPESATHFLDMCRIPCAGNFFMLHTVKGL